MLNLQLVTLTLKQGKVDGMEIHVLFFPSLFHGLSACYRFFCVLCFLLLINYIH